mmetsp:Transcript_34676/g.91465  ORF Transcript_34676/g.91465 Transcript_34676/m.91465 type:complete len:96 (+) Transcript_34676:381-668(+)
MLSLINFPTIMQVTDDEHQQKTCQYANIPSIMNCLSTRTYTMQPNAIIMSDRHDRQDGSCRPRNAKSNILVIIGKQDLATMSVSTFECSKAARLK